MLSCVWTEAWSYFVALDVRRDAPRMTQVRDDVAQNDDDGDDGDDDVELSFSYCLWRCP